MKFHEGDYVCFNISNKVVYALVLRNNPETAQCLVFITSDNVRGSWDHWWMNVGSLQLISRPNESRTVQKSI